MKSLNGYFSPDYFIARTRFRESAANRGAGLQTLPMTAKGPNGEDLTIDIAWFGSESPRRVLLHSSGLHGIEGFAGSAIQLQLLDKLQPLPADVALVVVHILNPYGMSWLRRVNENNVDLNRNFPSRDPMPERHRRMQIWTPSSIRAVDLLTISFFRRPPAMS